MGASTLGTVTRSLSTQPTYPSISGYTQSQGGTNTAPVSFQTSFPSNSVNTNYSLSFPYATLQQIFLWSDKGMTLRFNSASSPVPLITLQAGSPYEWNSSDGYFTSQFNTNITSVYVSCTPASQLRGFVLCT
jgi:hypothetical protein